MRNTSVDRQQQDQWWVRHVYQANVIQLTGRAIATGCLLGGLLSLTNLYVSAKAGATFGMGLTASILASMIYGVASQSTAVRPLHLLENNIIQTVAGAAGYMASALTASLAAFMVLQQQVLPWWQAMAWVIALSLLGMVFAIPLKRRFVNNLEFPFPEGQACGVVLAAMHQTEIAAMPSPSPGDAPGNVERGTTDALSHDPRQTVRMLIVSCFIAGVLKLLQSPTPAGKLRAGKLPHSRDAGWVVLSTGEAMALVDATHAGRAAPRIDDAPHARYRHDGRRRIDGNPRCQFHAVRRSPELRGPRPVDDPAG